MGKILAAAANTLRLLARDRAGLLVLFIMPAVLVVVITLVQENILELAGQRETEILLLDQDREVFSRTLQASLRTSRIRVREWDPEREPHFDMRQAIAKGRYQAGIIIAAGTSARLREELARLFTAHPGQSEGVVAAAAPPSLEILFDPGAMAGYRAGVLGRVGIAVQVTEMELKAMALGAVLAATVPQQSGGLAEGGLGEIFSRPLVSLQEQGAASGASALATLAAVANPVDQNVPAWALFGMFFTAIPIAGTLVQERRSGLSLRLACLPVSPLQLLTGGAAAYLGVCCSQFLLIVLIGIWLFPCLGLPPFTLSAREAASLLPLIAACGLAACAFGTFLGTICRSSEQASMLGATLVVVAAALGGVMVPVYAMPPLMQSISLFSPLNWGLHGCSELLVRGQSLGAVLDDLGRLLLFSVAMILFAWLRTHQRQR